MNKQVIVILLVAVGLSAFLYTRPKSVVKDETQEMPAKAEKSMASTATTEAKNDNHAVSLTKEQNEIAAGLYKQLAAATPENQPIVWGKLAELYVNASAADSAGYYFEKIAIAQPTTDNWLRAGDLYFQAYSLSLQTNNVSKFAEKAQNSYQKVLVKNPNNLHAKTNLAMTYVTSESPMKAIMALREVLDFDPSYEPALMNMGVLSLQSNQYDKAVGRFRQVLAKNPENINAQLGLAYSLIETGQKNEALELLKRLEKKDLDPVLRDEVQNTLQSIK